MLVDPPHISDEELLQAADGELAPRHAVEVQAHLLACRRCRARMTDIEGAIVDFVRVYRQANESKLPSIGGPRARLRAELKECSKTPTIHPRLWMGWTPAARMAAMCLAAVAALVVVSLFTLHQTSHGFSSIPPPFERGMLPERNLTPGATRSVSIREVCSIPHEDVAREVSSSMRDEVLNEYRNVNDRPEEYEIDYLIAPGLGGAEDIHNLWPQSFKPSKWNAHVKDQLEERLHQMVCSGDLDLPAAQHEIADDWIAAYKKYFHTDAPLLEAATPADSVRVNYRYSRFEDFAAFRII